MPFLTDNDIDERIKSQDNLVNRLTVHKIKPNKTITVPLEIKKIVGILSNEGENQKVLGEAFGMSQPNVSLTKAGMSSYGDVPELKELVQKVKGQNELNRATAESLAVESLLASLNLLPRALASTTKAKDISSVAKDMAMVSNMMGNKDDKDGKGERTMHLHLYAPKMKETKDYEIIDVGVE